MKFAKRLLMVAGAVVLAGFFSVMLAPKAVHAVVTSLVTVANTSSNPVPVYSTLGVAGQNAFQISAGCTWSGFSCTALSVYTVPQGDTAVVEFLSERCRTATGTAIVETDLQDAVSSASYAILPGTPSIPEQVSGLPVTVMASAVRVYLPPGTQLLWSVGSNGPGNPPVGFNCHITMYGQLIPL